ncbi:multidrug/biocide efflux PACE transporter [Undibacterium sp. TJN25]|uniref:multidrug/biocide efflux PACE transporter n=1 Tax=Undibacterium sp. TJN25 TaxID=3413056 RepID=UPI003BEFA5FF
MSNTAYTAHMAKKSLWERALHAILFEVTAIAISAPLLVGVMDISLSAAGTLTIFVSLAAMLWNVVFNMAFDRMLRSMRRGRDLKVRIVHAMAFELGLLLMVVPMAAWWLDISLLNAFLLDIGLVLFFLPYTLVFNWIYDAAREVLVKRQTAASS